MSKITKYALSDLYDMSSGLSSKKEQAGHGAPFVSFGTVFNNYFLPEELPDLMDTNEKEQQIYSIKAGDVLITRTSETIDELAMSCVAVKDYPKATYSGFTKRLRPKREGIAYPKYMAFYFRSALFRKAVTNNAFMTLRASFNEDIFTFLDVYLPDYDKQVRIGDILYRIECKIQKNKEINDYLEEMAKTIYDYWFVQFDFPDNCGMPYKSSGGIMVVTDGRKTIPKDWESLSIGNICTLKNGINYEKDIEGDKVYTIVNVRDITASSLFINNSSCDRISLPSSLANKYLISNDSILIARSGTPGAVRLVEGNDDNNIVYCGFIIAATPLDSRYRNYLAFTLKKYEGSNATQTGGSILKNVSQDTLNALTISYPPSDVIENFNSAIKPILHQLATNSDEINILIQLRNWLLPMLMNGQATIEDCCDK